MKSRWAKDEIRYAFEIGKRIVPVNIDDCTPRGWFLFRLSGLDVISYSNRDQKEKLMENLALWGNAVAFKKSIERYESSVGKNDLAYNNCRQQATTQLWEDINSFPFKIQTHLRNLNNALWSEGAKRITWRDKLEKYKKSGGVKFKNQLRRAGLI
jgi:hypothetical protein